MQDQNRKSLPHIPPRMGNRFMAYIHIFADHSTEKMERHDFFALAAASNDPCGHVWIDLDDMTSYFMDVVTEAQASTYRANCAEMEKLRKRDQRSHACVYARTVMCDGWKKGTDYCRTCPNFKARTVEADAPVDENMACLSDLYTAPAAQNPEELMVRHAEEVLVKEMLRSLSDKDRDIVTSRYVEELGFAEIGERLGLTQTYARTLCDRVIKRLEKNFRKDFE